MKVLILSKTKYGNTQVCVGGICTENGQFVRLLNPGGYYQPAEVAFKIGDVWDINFTVNTNKKEPHNEDVTIHNYQFVERITALDSYIKRMNVTIWQGDISNIFDGKILWQRNGKGYFSANIKNYPKHSVGFWISDNDLIFRDGYYIYNKGGIEKQIIYKGSSEAIPVINKNTLIRLSLAKWWKPENSDMEERCYLQLSGWYKDEETPIRSVVLKSENNIEKETEHLVHKNSEPLKKEQNTQNTDGPCYIATLCYKSPIADEVCTLRDFRDHTLANTYLGRRFISIYYRFGPSLAKRLSNSNNLNTAIRLIILNPIVYLVKLTRMNK